MRADDELLVKELTKAYSDHHTEVVEPLKKSIQELSGRMLHAEQQLVATGERSHTPLHADNGRSILANDLLTSRLKAMAEGSLSTGRMYSTASIPQLLQIKAAMVTGPSPAGFPTQAQRGPIVPPVQRDLMLLDFLQPPIGVAVDAFEHVRLIRTSYADVQTEGGVKRETSFTTELVTSRIACVAHHATFSAQVLADNGTLGQAVADTLLFDVLDKYEALIWTGDGVSNNDKIHGLLNLGTTVATTATTAADAISEALAIMRQTGYGNLVVAMNPVQWHTLRTERASMGDGQYLVGSWAQPAAPNIWNSPVVTSSSIPLGTAVLVDVTKVKLLDREQPSVLMSREHSDNFTKNLVTMLAELRAGLAVMDSGAVGIVELPTDSSP